MKRLHDELESTIPFVNNDFSEILQNQHMIAYSAYLDGLNDQPFSQNASNRGIILNGITIDAAPNIGNDLHFFNWNLTIDKEALVYFDGQYYSPDLTLLTNSSLTYTYQRRLFIYPTTTTQSRSFPDPRAGLSDDRVRRFRVGTTQSIYTDYVFKIHADSSNTPFTPGTTPPPFPGGSSNTIPYILLEYGGTSRNLSRLLKLKSTNSGDVLITYNPKRWDITSGVPKWNSYNTYGYYRDFGFGGAQGIFITGSNELQGFRVLSYGTIDVNSAGKFMVGYDYTSPTTPTSATAGEFNYGLARNYGGLMEVGLLFSQYGPHSHDNNTKISNDNMDHAHRVEMAMPTTDEHKGPNSETNWLRSPRRFYPGKVPNTVDQGSNFRTRGLPVFKQLIDPKENSHSWGDNPQYWDSTTYDSSLHKHQILSDNLDNEPHENRPPYVVTLFYTKI